MGILANGAISGRVVAVTQLLGSWCVNSGPDGVEIKLYFISPDWKMMAVDVSTSPAFQSGTQRDSELAADQPNESRPID
jgi:hypothetical protein